MYISIAIYGSNAIYSTRPMLFIAMQPHPSLTSQEILTMASSLSELKLSSFSHLETIFSF